MVNPLNIILPLLFAKPKPAATPPEKHPFQAAEEFASVLRTVADATDNDLGQRPLSGGGSVKNGLIYREAAVKELTKMAVTASSRQTRVFARCTNAIELLPEAEDAAIIKHGNPVPHYETWCNSDGEPVTTLPFGYECPFCGDPDIKKFRPTCGAKMDKEG